jgi:pimeloyl-ACP methyl ester carboxylesterase
MTDTDPTALAILAMPTLVVCGDADDDNGSADRLVAALPDAVRAVIPGTHMGSVTGPALGEAIRDFLC